MSEEYYPTTKVAWDAFVLTDWPNLDAEGKRRCALRWATDDEVTPSRARWPAEMHRLVTDGFAYVHCFRGRPDFEEPNSTYFEVFGRSADGPGISVLWAIARRLEITLLNQYWLRIITPTEIISEIRGHDKTWSDAIAEGVRAWHR